MSDRSRISAVLCSLVIGVLMTGCASHQSPQKTVGQKTEEAGLEEKEQTSSEEENADTQAVETEEDKKVGILLPSGSIQRWNEDAFYIQSQLEAEGYQIDLRFSQNDPKLQKKQMKELVKQKMDCLVVAPIDSEALKEAAVLAEEAGIPIISYDRLFMNTDAVDYYVTFDNKNAGRQLARKIIKNSGLKNLQEGDYRTIEFFMGDGKDQNAKYLYQGMMEVLQPYLENGQLLCRSGRTSFGDTKLKDWSEKRAEARCRSYLEDYYGEEDLDIIASAFDPFSYACIDQLQEAGYTQENWPLISGQDAQVQACRYIQEGLQSFSVFKDTRVLAQHCAAMVDQVCKGEEVPVTDLKHYKNNKKTVPADVCGISVVTKKNMTRLLVDSGYYQENQIFFNE